MEETEGRRARTSIFKHHCKWKSLVLKESTEILEILMKGGDI